MQIRSFIEAQVAALGWLREYGGVSEHVRRRPDPKGWRLDESGFYQSRDDNRPPRWCVRYWHLNKPQAAGVLIVDADGKVEPGAALWLGCLGVFPPGLYRVEPDALTPVKTGYGEGLFEGDDWERVNQWCAEGWTSDAYG